MNLFSKTKGPVATLAGIFGLALTTVVLLCGAGSVPVENFSPQGAMQADLNAGGHNLTNVATLSATNVTVSGSLSAANLGSAATNAASAFAPASGSANYVAGSTNSVGSVLIPTYGTVGDFIPKPQQAVVVPSIALRQGPQSGYVVPYGDSLTQGIGVINQTVGPGYVGYAVSYPGQLAAMPFCSAMTTVNMGISGQTTAQGNFQYAGNAAVAAVDSTITTNGTTTATVTGSTSGIPSSGCLASQDIPINTTYTLSGTTLTLSVAATGSHTSKLASFIGAPLTYNGYTGCAHWLSPAITGQAFALLPLNYGTNDYYVGGITSSGTATNGGATITSMTISTALSVGSASLTGASGYSVWGLTAAQVSAGTPGAYLGTVSSSTSSSVTLSSGALVTSSMTTFKLCPSPSAWETSYSGLVTKAVTDGYTVAVESLTPAYNGLNSSYGHGQYQENRLLYNAWLQSTYAAATGCIFVDVGNLPALQTNSTVYYPLTGAPAGLHLSENGYQLWAQLVNSQLTLQLSSQLANYLLPFTRYGINANWLPQVAARTDLSNVFTADQTVGTQTGGSSGNHNLNVWGSINVEGSLTNGTAGQNPTVNIGNGSYGNGKLVIYHNNGAASLLSLQENSGNAELLGPSGNVGFFLTSSGDICDDGFTVNSINGFYDAKFTLSNANGAQTDLFDCGSSALTVTDNGAGGTWLSVAHATGLATFKALSTASLTGTGTTTLTAASGSPVTITRGTVTPSFGTNNNLWIGAAAGGYNEIRLQTGAATFDFGVNDTAGAYFFNNANTPTYFGTNGAERMRIQAGGNVCIGSTTDNSNGILQLTGGNLFMESVGKTVSLKGGSNAASGTITLVAGTGTITSTAITASDVVLLSQKTAGGTAGTYPPLAAVSTGTIVVTGLSTDTSTYNWAAIHANQ